MILRMYSIPVTHTGAQADTMILRRMSYRLCSSFCQSNLDTLLFKQELTTTSRSNLVCQSFCCPAVLHHNILQMTSHNLKDARLSVSSLPRIIRTASLISMLAILCNYLVFHQTWTASLLAQGVLDYYSSLSPSTT